MIGFELDWKVHYFYESWFDEAPACVGIQWKQKFPLYVEESSWQVAERHIGCLSYSQGYCILWPDLDHGRVVFHREVYGTMGLNFSVRSFLESNPGECSS